jgi:hypothetical protein
VRQKRVYLACFLLHFFIIVTIASRETLWLIAHGLTVLPAPLKAYSEKAETVTSAALAQTLAASNPIRRALLTYLHVAGIERAYGYFAPNVPANCKLVFELHHTDGRIEYEIPRGNTPAADLRMASLLDEIGRTRHAALREYLVKMLARSVWREYSDVKTIRAILGSRNLPSIDEFERGVPESYQFLYAYDFSLGDESFRGEAP